MGKTIFRSVDLSPEQLDGKAWLEMAKHFEEIYLIGVSPDRRFHRGTTLNIHVVLLPNLPSFLGVLCFWAIGSVLALWLTYRRGVSAWSLSEPVSGLCALPLRLLTRARILFQVQAELFNLPAERFPWYRRFVIGTTTKWICGHSHYVRAVSKRVAEQVVRAGVPAGKVEVFPSRCDTSQFDPGLFTADRVRIRRELGIQCGQTLIMFVGRLVLSKGITYILKATAELARIRTDFRVVIVGNGEQWDELREEATALEVDEVLQFTGSVPYKNVPAMLAAADVFLSPSLDEGMPRTVLEALSMELPVVVTDVGGNGEILSGASCGYLLPSRQVQGLVIALNQLLDDPEKARQMGREGRQMIKSRYDFTSQIRSWAEAHYGVR